MSIIKHKDKRTGVTYVYESESYWDKEKKQPRSRRTLIGKLDEETGEIIPTGKSGKKKASEEASKPGEVSPITAQVELLAEKNALIKELKAENAALKKEKEDILRMLQELCDRYRTK